MSHTTGQVVQTEEALFAVARSVGPSKSTGLVGLARFFRPRHGLSVYQSRNNVLSKSRGIIIIHAFLKEFCSASNATKHKMFHYSAKPQATQSSHYDDTNLLGKMFSLKEEDRTKQIVCHHSKIEITIHVCLVRIVRVQNFLKHCVRRPTEIRIPRNDVAKTCSTWTFRFLPFTQF